MAALLSLTVSLTVPMLFLHSCCGYLSRGQQVGGKIAAILGARVKLAAGVLPDATPLIPVKAQSTFASIGFRAAGYIEPNPFADDLRQFV